MLYGPFTLMAKSTDGRWVNLSVAKFFQRSAKGLTEVVMFSHDVVTLEMPWNEFEATISNKLIAK